ncbi:hypothetical protein ABPG74_014977 [Tetrahymena malaccensis]
MSSRLIVKNIPTNVDEKKLKEIFSKFGSVTDAKVCLNGQKHRRFCFIGYKSEADATKAKEYFNNTYIQMNKIQVDFAKTSDDPNIVNQKNKKFQKRDGKQQDQKLQKKVKKNEEQPSEIPADSSELTPEQKFEEFKKLMKSGSKGTMSWNDVLTTIKSKPTKKELKNQAKNNKKKGNNENEEEENEDFAQTALDDLDKQFDKIKSKKNKGNNDNENGNQDQQEENQEVSQDAKQNNSSSSNDPMIDDCRLYVLNLPYDINEEEVKDVFRKYGKLLEIKMPKGKGGQFRGFAYITYSMAGEAMRAFAELDNKIQFGRILHIRPAFKETKSEEQKKIEEEKSKQDIELEKSSFKKQKKSELKKSLNDDTNWNTLFLNPNTILETVASRYNIKKSDILSPDAENAAVRIAHAETQIIAETKEWMLKQGLSLDFLNQDRKNCERSNNTILVKNISSKVEQDGLRDLFSRYGHVSKFLLAPNKAIGVVQYEDQSHALNAFEKLSYFSVKNNPLYLEWAPLGMIDVEQAEEEKEKEIEIEDELSKILYIKNLNFNTTESTLQSLFEKAKVGTIRSVKIVKNKGQSQGYGFIEFSDHEAVVKSIKKLQNSLLDGHSIQLSVSKKEKNDQKKKERKQKQSDIPISTKLVIRNLAFECTKKEVRDLLKVYGEVKSVRLPKKMNGQHRGFAFAEFSSAEEAKNAFTALENTHLYGRKLAIEWAKTE